MESYEHTCLTERGSVMVRGNKEHAFYISRLANIIGAAMDDEDPADVVRTLTSVAISGEVQSVSITVTNPAAGREAA